MYSEIAVILDILALAAVFFSIIVVLIKWNLSPWMDHSFFLLLISLAIGSIINILESSAIIIAFTPYEDFFLPLIWSFWFFSIIKKQQLIDLQKTRDKLRKSEQNTRMLLQNLPLKIYLKNSQSVYITCNTNFASDFERVPEEIAGKNDYDLYPSEQADTYRSSDKRIIETGKAEETKEMNVRQRWMQITRTPVVNEKNEVTGILGIMQDITEKHIVQENLRKNEEQLRFFLENFAGIAYQTPACIFQPTLFYGAVEKITGYSSEHFIDGCIRWKELVYDEDLKNLIEEKTCQSNASDYTIDTEYRIVTQSGDIRWVRDLSRKVHIDGKPVIQGSIFDITERKKTIEALAKNEELLRLAQQSAKIGIWEHDLRSGKSTWTKELEEIYGYAEGAFPGTYAAFSTLVYPDDLKHLEHIRDEAIKEHHPFGIDIRIVTPSGEIRWVDFRGAAMYDEAGHPIRIIGVCTDITSRKRSEETLKRNEELLRLAQQSARIGIWEYNLQNGQVYWTMEMEKIHGYPEGTFPSTYENFRKNVYPGDLLPFESARDEAIREHRTFDVDFRIVIPLSDEIRWVNTKGAAVYDEKGQPLQIYGVSTDITERKIWEKTLLDNDENLRTTLNSLVDAVIATDTTGKIVRINPAAERLTGWNASEALGKMLSDVFIIIDSDTGENIPDPVSRIIHTGIDTNVIHTTTLISRDNRQYHIADSAAPIHDVQGTITGFVLVFHDVSEEYATRKALQESEERYRLFYETSPYALLSINGSRLSNPNPSALKLFRCSREELEQATPWDLSPERQPDGSLSRDKARRYINDALDGHPQYFEWRHQRIDGTRFDAEIALTRLFLKGKPQITATILDITDRKNALENLRTSLHEKETLLQEIYHRTKNNMMVISSFLELQAASVDNNEVDRIVQDSTARIRTMSFAHEMLYKGKNLSRINMKDYLTGLVQLLASGNNISPEKIEQKFDIDDVNLLIDIAIPCGLIINELLTNSFKYAFPGDKKGFVAVGLKKIGEKKLEMSVRDNGVGFPADLNINHLSTLGIQLVFQIACHQLHAKTDVTTKNGLHWRIVFNEDLYSDRIQP